MAWSDVLKAVIPIVVACLAWLLDQFEKVALSSLSVSAGVVVRNYALEPMDEAEVASLTAWKASSVRAERNRRLADADWTKVADAPVDSVAWAAYRQALRDISAQAGFPWDVQWPEMTA